MGGSGACPPDGKRGLCLNPKGQKYKLPLKKKSYSLKTIICPKQVLIGNTMEPVSLFQDSASPVSSRGPGQRAAHGQPQGGATFPHRSAPSSGPQTNLPRGKGCSSILVSFIMKSFRCVTGQVITGQPPTRPCGLGTGTRCTLLTLCALSTLPVRPREPLLNS